MLKLNRAVVVGLSLTAAVSLAACGGGGDGGGQKSESKTQQSNYDRLVKQDPAHTMANSPTRKTINGWIDTWGKDSNKLAYVYMQNANGDLIGYYVLKGLPVSYCTSLTPSYRVITPEIQGDNNVPLMVPAPSVDGVYYSGGECNTYYGFDATTGAYIEYTAGLGINVLLYDQPLTNRPNVQPLGPTRIK